MKDFLSLKYSPETIREKTREIYQELVSNPEGNLAPNFDKICPNDLMRMFRLYDERFFNNFFRDNLDGRIRFRLSTRMTSSGGKTTRIKLEEGSRYEICLSVILLFQNFKVAGKEIIVNGLKCKNRLEAAMRIMEHEIIHLLEMHIFEKSSCRGERFKSLVGKIFGHTDVIHQLVTRREWARKELDLKPGDRVSFEFDGKTKKGIIHRITRRATVLVKDSRGYLQDRKGNRYVKYYVPISDLKKFG